MKKYKNKIIIFLIILLGITIQYKYINFLTLIIDDTKESTNTTLSDINIYLDNPDTYNTIYYNSSFPYLVNFKEYHYKDKKMQKIIKYKYWKKNDKNICQNLYNNITHNNKIYDNYIKDIPSFFSLDNYYYYVKQDNRDKCLLIANIYTNTVYLFYY